MRLAAIIRIVGTTVRRPSPTSSVKTVWPIALKTCHSRSASTSTSVDAWTSGSASLTIIARSRGPIVISDRASTATAAGAPTTEWTIFSFLLLNIQLLSVTVIFWEKVGLQKYRLKVNIKLGLMEVAKISTTKLVQQNSPNSKIFLISPSIC